MPSASHSITETFGRWTIVGRAPPLRRSSGGGICHVRCRCECGTERPVSLANLKSGKSTSCGCYRRKSTAVHKTKHGDARKGAVAVEFNTWQAMIARCSRPTCTNFSNYGGRGIKVCQRWRKSYSAFLSDMGRRPSPKYSLDRRNNNRNYTPSNCRWATRKVQRANQRPRKRIDQFTSVELVAELKKRGYQGGGT